MNWADYEKEIYDWFKSNHKDADISYNQSIKGRYSKKNRQIDILIESYLANKKIRLIVDCKYFNKKIDVKTIESFSSMVEDVEATQGILVTNKGYSQAALNFAHNNPTDIELDILNFDDLKLLQGFGGTMYVADTGAIVPAPFGWVIDASRRTGCIATMYQRGLTYEQALLNKEWIYVNIIGKVSSITNIEQLVKYQERLTKINHPLAKFEYTKTIKRNDNSPTLLRTIKIESYPTNEYTGFIEFDDFFILFVLFTPNELKNKNLRKLTYLIEKTFPMKVNQDSIMEADLAVLEKKLAKENDQIKRAEWLVMHGQLLMDYKKYDRALQKFNESISVLPTCAGAFRGKIEIGLYEGFTLNEITPLIEDYFQLGPKNPTVCHDIMGLFAQFNRFEDIVPLLIHGAEIYKSQPEAVGNFNYNIVLFLERNGKRSLAQKHLMIAKKAFQKVLPKDHYVFSNIESIFERLRNPD